MNEETTALPATEPTKRELRREKRKNRITELDVLRAVAVFLMVIDHIAYDLWGLLPMAFRDYPAAEGFSRTLYRLALDYWQWDVRAAVRYVVLFVFLGLTGVCCSFARSNLNRGLKLLAAGLILSAGTFAVSRMVGDPDITIAFGILHCIATALILIGLLEKLTSNKWVFLAIGLVLTGLGIYLRVRYGEPFRSYTSGPFYELFANAFIGRIAIGSDCFAFPLHGGQVFLGVFLGKLFYPGRQPVYRKPSPYWDSFVTFVGRNSLWIYLIHQFLLPLIIGTVLLICGFHLDI